jgi:hypothetical protein
MQQVIFRFWQSTPKPGFGLGFVTGGLFMGLVAFALLGAGAAHAHDFKKGYFFIKNQNHTQTMAAKKTFGFY